jgi:four helix bundle protein
MPFKFEKLQVWSESIELSGVISDVARTFPKHEQFVLTSQLQRAADSVSLNIAEGSTGQSDPELRKFLGYSIRSGMEVICCIYLAKRRRIISIEDFDSIYKQTDKLSKRIQALRKSLS